MARSVNIAKVRKELDAVDRAFMKAEESYAPQEAQASRRKARSDRQRSELEAKYMPKGNA